MDFSQYSGWPLAVITASIFVYLYYWNAFNYWKKRGIPGPNAYPFVGSIYPMLINNDKQIEWVRKYGTLFGVYNGTTPTLVVSDLDTMKEVCIKNFHIFPNHVVAEFNSKLADGFLFNAQDDQWRNIRAIMTPTFTASKMRRMHKLLDQCADNLLEALQERSQGNPVVNIKDLFSLYTMDAIASCCYALRLANYKSEVNLKTASKQNEFVRLGLDLFNFRLWRLVMVLVFKMRILKFFKFSLIPLETEWAFASHVQQMVENRRKSGKHYDDYLQTLIGSVESDSDKASESSPVGGTLVTGGGESRVAENGAKSGEETDEVAETKSSRTKARHLSEIEMLSNATYILLAAFETTSINLTHCIYTLSFHQSIQEKLHQTIKSLAEFDDQNRATFDHDTLMSCEYLDAVISETLRSHPPILVTDRFALEDHNLAPRGIFIPKGMRVFFTMNAILNDPEIWPEPEVFNPDRFAPGQREGRDPLAFCPFGIGPRQCVGIRFALTETKLAVAKLLMKYRFEPAPGTRYPGQSSNQAGFNSLKRPLVTVINR